jgi:hypothetical protein
MRSAGHRPVYGNPVDVKRAADLNAKGWTLRQIGAEPGVHWSTVSDQLRRAGVTMRRGGPSVIRRPLIKSWSCVTRG